NAALFAALANDCLVSHGFFHSQYLLEEGLRECLRVTQAQQHISCGPHVRGAPLPTSLSSIVTRRRRRLARVSQSAGDSSEIVFRVGSKGCSAMSLAHPEGQLYAAHPIGTP